MSLSIIVPCMGRLKHAMLSIPPLMTSGYEVILVDYSCPEKSGIWITKKHKIRVVNVEGERWFNLSRARNAGAMASASDWICFLDADVVLCSAMLESFKSLMQRENCYYGSTKMHGHATLVKRKDYLAAGRFDESLQGYGGQDIDFQNRLGKLGLQFIPFMPLDYQHISHENDLRIAFHENDDMEDNKQKNLLLLREKQNKSQEIDTVFESDWGDGFGDVWMAVNRALQYSELTGKRVGIHPSGKGLDVSNKVREMLQTIESQGELEIISDAGVKHRASMSCSAYLRTKTKWAFGPYKRISLQLNGISKRSLSDAEKTEIKAQFPGYEFVELGLPMSISENVEMLAKSDLLIGTNSGMAHLAKSVGTPMLILGDEQDVKGWLKYGFTFCPYDAPGEKIKKLAEETMRQPIREKTAILVMLAAGCETGMSRLWKSLEKFSKRQDIDVYASMDGVDASLPAWVRRFDPPAGTGGIVRPTKASIETLYYNYSWILRLTWDAEIIDELDWKRDENSVYGELRSNPGCLQDILSNFQQMGLTYGDPNHPYVDGFAILAHRNFWRSCYLPLPPSVVHYRDDAVSCQLAAANGWKLIDKKIATHKHFEWREYENARRSHAVS